MFNSTFFFWVFIVCGAIAMALFHGKVPDQVNASNAWGFVVGVIGVISIIVSRVLAWSEINASRSNDRDNAP
jgi:hypothetical protein